MVAMTAPARPNSRERILTAATDLFYRQGILATGVEELAATAHVSKRTLYQQFPSKDAVAVAYLNGITLADLGPAMAGLRDSARPARERLLDIFTLGPMWRGCPFLNASAEFADPSHPARAAAREHKEQFIEILVDLSAEAGAPDPDELGHQLALLFDGARSQGIALDSEVPLRYARPAAAALLAAALDGPR
jgi:AcrR family transcriptional regulator